MSLNIKPLTDKDYDEVLCEWWKDWRWTPPAKDFLPETGYMVYYNGLYLILNLKIKTLEKKLY